MARSSLRSLFHREVLLTRALACETPILGSSQRYWEPRFGIVPHQVQPTKVSSYQPSIDEAKTDLERGPTVFCALGTRKQGERLAKKSLGLRLNL